MLPTSQSFKLTASGTVKDYGTSNAVKRVVLSSMLIGTDGVNDPAVTVYNGTDNTGQEIVPTATYDASQLGINGFILIYAKRCPDGIYVEISLAAGDVEVVIDYAPMGRAE